VQPQEKEGLPVTSVYNTHSHKKQWVILQVHLRRITHIKQ
jgi:hypothetical protein